MYQANTNQKKAEVPILISDTAEFKARDVTRSEEQHYMMIKELILQEDIMILYVCAYSRASNSMRQKLIEVQGEID